MTEQYVPGELIVKFRPGIPAKARQKALGRLGARIMRTAESGSGAVLPNLPQGTAPHAAAVAFRRLFPVILTDNGTEFSNPAAIEIDHMGRQRTRLFYCDSASPHQKAELERSHEFIRMVLPKGSSLDHLTQDSVFTGLSHQLADKKKAERQVSRDHVQLLPRSANSP